MASAAPVAADAPQQDVEAMWQELNAGIRDVYAHRQMTSERFMQLYTYVYNYCTKNPSGNDASGGGRRSGRQQRSRAGIGNSTDGTFPAGFVGHDLYHRIRDLIKTYLTDLARNANDKMGEDLLNFYLTQWESFTFSSKVMNGFCSYLNRHWIRREHDHGREHICQIYQLALDIWKETFFEPLHNSVISVVLQLINRDRNGETINSSMVKGMMDSLVELGKDRNAQDIAQNQNHNDDLSIYRRRFEDAFIAESETYYASESVAFLNSGKTVPDYLKKAEQRLNEERRRVGTYLHPTTLDRLMTSCENVLIEKQLSTLHEEFPILLKASEMEDMGRMYDLVSRLPDSFGNMKEILQSHIASEGAAAVALNKDHCNNDPKEYIKIILDVYQKFHDLVSKAFRHDPGFVGALDRGCGAFINHNALTNDSRSVHKSPEMLARYCDSLLRKSGRNHDEQELEDLLNLAMVIFKFIEDKDAFQKYYIRMLANRLVGNLSASDDAESSMIAKLKVACGFEYTLKLQRMFQNVALSKDMNDDFKTWLGRQEVAEPMKAEFYMMILQSGAWPFSPDVNDAFVLPQVLEPCVNIFSQYYAEMHTGRKLNWLYSKCRGEIVSHCFGQKYTFIMSTYSINILLQYNSKDSYKLHELAEVTQLREDIAIQIIQQFLKANLLKSDDDEDKLSFKSEISLNKDYKSKKLKINLMAPLKTEMKLEEERVQTSIEDGRVYEVEAAIVRVMKSRKVMEHQLLLSEVVTLVRKRFSPPVPLIKRCIDKLIETEYLGRKEGAQNVYEYRT